MVWVEQNPYTNVKFSLEYQKRTFNILLYDESIVLDFVSGISFFLCLVWWSLCFLCLQNLIDFSVTIWHRILHRWGCLFSLFFYIFCLFGFFRRLFLFHTHLFFSRAVLFDKLYKGVHISEHMDASPSIQVCRLQKPQVERIKVAHWHWISSMGSLFEVKGLEFCDRSLYRLRLLHSGTSHTFKSL